MDWAFLESSNAALGGRGEAVLLTGEAGVGKTRLLVEARREAERPGVVVLRGRAVESGGAYRPLVDAFARASAPFADEADRGAPSIAWSTDRPSQPRNPRGSPVYTGSPDGREPV